MTFTPAQPTTTTCSTCGFAAASPEVPDDFRQCRRHSPTIPPIRTEGDLEWLAVWPTVHQTNWCGDWSPAPGNLWPAQFSPDTVAGFSLPPPLSADQLAALMADAAGLPPPASSTPDNSPPSYDDA